MHALSLADSIERYADLCARLDAAFPDRAAVLRAANLDESSLTGLQAHWTAQLITPSGEEIAARFGAAYAAARSRLIAHDEDTWPADSTAANRTAEIRCHRFTPALPFVPARPGEESGIRPAPAFRRVHEPPIRPASSATEASERTMEIPVFAPRPPVLPFAPPQPPFRRLHRFDSQTGLPLPNPYWIDEPSAADPTKSA